MNVYIVLFLFNNVIYVFLLLCLCILILCLCMATLTEVFPCFFLSCKANARVKPAKTGHGPHSSYYLCCSMYCLFCVVLRTVCMYMCTVLLPPGGYPMAVKYIVSHQSNGDIHPVRSVVTMSTELSLSPTQTDRHVPLATKQIPFHYKCKSHSI
jgi:hypothetical protein